MTWKCSQTLWDYEFFTEKIANFKERKLRIYINFNLKNQIYFFSLVRRLYWSDVCTGPTFVLVRRLYWSDVCTGPTFVLVRRMYCPTFVSLRFVPSDVCGSDVCTSTDVLVHFGWDGIGVSVRLPSSATENVVLEFVDMIRNFSLISLKCKTQYKVLFTLWHSAGYLSR